MKPQPHNIWLSDMRDVYKNKGSKIKGVKLVCVTVPPPVYRCYVTNSSLYGAPPVVQFNTVGILAEGWE